MGVELMHPGKREFSVDIRLPEGSDTQQDAIAEEHAVAISYNGISQAVMMATPPASGTEVLSMAMVTSGPFTSSIIWA